MGPNGPLRYDQRRRWHGGHGGLALPLPGVRSSAKLARWQRRAHNVEERSSVHGLPASFLAQRAWWSRGAVLELRSRMEFDRAFFLHAQHARFVSCAVAPLP